MKKTLVFAMAMALGVTATAFAANPFSDVPAGHWAYGAVAKLAAAGVIDGYPDGTFEGGKTITRYEMAQMIAKAMAKGAIGADDRLVSEFASELDNLGVRVARLEKKADNVKISGVIRYSYYDSTGEKTHDSVGKLRSRLYFTGDVNKNWSYNGMLQNNSGVCGGEVNGHDEKTEFKEAYLTGKYGNFKATIGRYNTVIGEGNLWDERVDAVKLEYGKNFKVVAEAGKLWSADVPFTRHTFRDPRDAGKKGSKFDASDTKVAGGTFWRIGLGYDAKNFAVEANYFKAADSAMYDIYPDPYKGFHGGYAEVDRKVFTLGAKYKGNNWGIGAEYLRGDYNGALYEDGAIGGKVESDDKNGYVINVHWAGAKASKPGTWGIYANYYNQPASTVIAHTMNGSYDPRGFKGWMAGVNYTVAKNMVAAFEYYDVKSKEDDSRGKTLWTQLVVTF